MPVRRHGLFLIAFVLLSVQDTRARDTSARKTVPDYRYFRALSIDLQGRSPTRAELAQFEQPGFDLDHWIDLHVAGPQYVERVRRIYMDMLRLELPATYKFEPGLTTIYALKVAGPKGPLEIYYRLGQRRANPETDGQVCFTEAESGLKILEAGRLGVGTAKPISEKLLDERTELVKPWWLYADYRNAKPKDRASPEWLQRFGFDAAWSMFVEPDGTPTSAIRVCKEEAQATETGRVLATGRRTKADPIPEDRTTRAPLDTAFATAHAGQPVSCLTTLGYKSSNECGCGIGLERCLPASPAAFVVPIRAPLGPDEPFVATPRPAWMWLESWWTAEATHFMDAIFDGDRDVRELLTSRATVINGPLAQFYRFFTGATCCGNYGPDLGFTEPEPLFDPAAIPRTLAPQQAGTWTPIADRGPHASGLLTMPSFLIKYGTRRARAHILYSTFLCKDFVADNSVVLAASTEPDLMVRSGCSTCHETLEPMAAYFTRVQESDWTYLPPKWFPVSLDRCEVADPKRLRPECKAYYDPAFTDATHTVLRGGYGDRDHIDQGPAGLAAEITQAPEFAPCVASNVAQSLLGRALTPEDESWKVGLAKAFVAGGYRMRPLVRAIVASPQYRPGAR